MFTVEDSRNFIRNRVNEAFDPSLHYEKVHYECMSAIWYIDKETGKRGGLFMRLDILEVHVDSRLLCTLTIAENLDDERCVVIETYNAEHNGCSDRAVWVSPTLRV